MKLVQQPVYLEYTRSLSCGNFALVLNWTTTHKGEQETPHCQIQNFASTTVPSTPGDTNDVDFCLGLHSPGDISIHFLTTPAVSPPTELTLGLF